jgi:hypothetical protein
MRIAKIMVKYSTAAFTCNERRETYIKCADDGLIPRRFLPHNLKVTQFNWRGSFAAVLARATLQNMYLYIFSMMLIGARGSVVG